MAGSRHGDGPGSADGRAAAARIAAEFRAAAPVPDAADGLVAALRDTSDAVRWR
ncbi:hypothetical protein [Streptomyces anthocyanicus]|uniref:hypothetical protein n=1 Tax=Streptomyces anthocyanicus TaxID=68174 RepID=UPI00216B20C0|nr:hypothetical protein [Streptomyces anthocyanicus]